MDVKTIREKLAAVLKEQENDTKYRVFIDDYTMLLDEVKVNTDTANLAIEAVKLDQGTNFLDIFAELDKKQIKDAWKIILNCGEFKKNTDDGTFELMCSFAASALAGDANTYSILGNILTAMVNSAKLPEQEKIDTAAYEIVRELLLEALPKNTKFPEWETVKMASNHMESFCTIMEHTLALKSVQEAGNGIPAAFNMNMWIAKGKQYVEETRILKEKKKNKPPKRSMELRKLAEHFEKVEEELDKAICETARLTSQIDFLQERLNESERTVSEKDKEIKVQQTEIEGLKTRVSQANQEVDERKKLNDAQVQYREDTQAALLQDIARALKPEYGDYAETINVPMNEMLGKIYREKLKQIFKILEQKGIKVGN